LSQPLEFTFERCSSSPTSCLRIDHRHRSDLTLQDTGEEALLRLAG
jgi:hypothetical protein